MKKFFAIISFLLLISPAFAETDFQQGQAKVTATVLNVRNIASTGGEIAGSVKRGDIVDVTERSKNESTVDNLTDFWYKIRFTEGKDSKSGWVFGSYLSFELNMESGLRWKNLSPAGGQKLTAVALSNAGEVYTGTDQGNIFITADKGKTWKKVMPQALGINIGGINRIIINGKTVLIAARGGNRGGIWKSSNGGS